MDIKINHMDKKSATWKKTSRDKNVEANSVNQIKITMRSITSRLHNAGEKYG